MTKFTEEQFIIACRGTYGIQNRIAENLKVTPAALTQRLNRNPNWHKHIQQEKDDVLDLAETELVKIIAKGNIKTTDKLNAIKFLLSTQGLKRGYAPTLTTKNLNLNIDNPSSAKNMNALYMEIQENEVKANKINDIEKRKQLEQEPIYEIVPSKRDNEIAEERRIEALEEGERLDKEEAEKQKKEEEEEIQRRLNE